MAETHRITCPMCGSSVRVPAALSGKRGRCPKCGEEIPLPPSPPATEAKGIALSDPPEEGMPAIIVAPPIYLSTATKQPRKMRVPRWAYVVAISLFAILVVAIVYAVTNRSPEPVVDEQLDEDQPHPVLPSAPEQPERPRTVEDMTVREVQAVMNRAATGAEVLVRLHVGNKSVEATTVPTVSNSSTHPNTITMEIVGEIQYVPEGRKSPRWSKWKANAVYYSETDEVHYVAVTLGSSVIYVSDSPDGP